MNAESVKEIVTAANAAQDLSVIGVLFLFIFFLLGIIIYKIKKEDRITELSESVSSLAKATNDFTSHTHELTEANNKIVIQKIEVIWKICDRIEEQLKFLERIVWQNSVNERVVKNNEHKQN